MMDRRKILKGSLLRWWKAVASEYDWTTDTPKVAEAESHLNEAHEEFYTGRIKLSDVHAVFDEWVAVHERRAS
jgi:hypothetical protein